jgi:hypothetical protein
MIESDSGENLLRKAKLAVRFVNSHLASSWVQPMQGPSGKGRDGSQIFVYNFGAATTLFHFLCILHLMLIADVLHDCKVSGFAEKERLRIEKILKKNPMSDAKAVPYEAKIKWFCTTFLLFVELGLPSGKAKCLALFETNSGSGPSKKASKKSSLDKASTDEITTSILQTGGRSARRAVQGISAQSSKTPTIDLTVDESANFHDSETRTLLLNHNGLASWNSLLSMAVQFGDSTEKIQIARDNYTAHLLIPLRGRHCSGIHACG